MEPILQWGLESIRLIQSFANPPLTAGMRIVTNLGSAPAYIVLLPLVYWCYDEKKGLQLGAAVLISAWLNLSLKFLLDQPRPFFAAYDPSLGMIPESLGGFPSGHAQNSLVLWMIIASWGNKKRFFCAAALLCLLISFSRVYLGVHFPTDIVGGWLLGGVVLCVWFLAGKRIGEWIGSGGFRAGMIAAAAAAFIMILYRPGVQTLMPGGMLLGMGAGYCLNKRYIGLSAAALAGTSGAAKYGVLLARFVVGMAGMVLVFTAGEKMSSPGRATGNYPLFYFLRFTVLALWITVAAPRLFCFLHLSAMVRTENHNGSDTH
jgi:membrane-associated phospholipid phosphatase